MLNLPVISEYRSEYNGMEHIEFTVVCAWGQISADEPKRDLLRHLLMKPFPGITPKTSLQETFGFWISPSGIPAIEAGITADFSGSLKAARSLASMVGLALNQRAVQITIKSGIELKDKQLIFPFQGAQEKTFRSLIKLGISGATVLGNELRVNTSSHKSLDTYKALKDIFQCDGIVENVTFISHSPSSA